MGLLRDPQLRREGGFVWAEIREMLLPWLWCDQGSSAVSGWGLGRALVLGPVPFPGSRYLPCALL